MNCRPPTSADDKRRGFATDVVNTLRDAGFAALWAGGCVRDQLLGLVPKDYDVATNATPDTIRRLFGRRKTLAVGASFGVIVVLGPRGAGQIDVATFRQDAAYSDGRHPDAVTFASAEEDAKRRDFTINGLFFDPLTNQVIDYVGGQKDLAEHLIRAIGDPVQRLTEDKLRMIRAVRFAATFEFQIEPATFAAIRDAAQEIATVSAERIAMELRRMLADPHAVRAVKLLAEAGLLQTILPQVANVYSMDTWQWQQTLEVLGQVQVPSFCGALAILLRATRTAEVDAQACILELGQQLRLSNEEVRECSWLLEQEQVVRHARELDWAQLQPVLVHKFTPALLNYADAVARVLDASASHIDFCREKLRLPKSELDPPPLITGDALRAHRVPPGPVYRVVLKAVRDAQLRGEVTTEAEAWELAQKILQG